MTALDMAMLLLMGGMAVAGFMRGFVQEVLSLLAWFVAIVAVRLFLAPVTDLVGVSIGAGGAASVLAFAGLFVLTFIVGKLLAKWVGERVRTSLLGPVDRVLGVGFGALKGLLVATLAFLAFTLVYDFIFSAETARPLWMTEARSYPLLNASSDALSQAVRDREDKEGAANADEKGSPADGQASGLMSLLGR